MQSAIVTHWLRDIAERLTTVLSIGVFDEADVKQCIDLADTLDDERNSTQQHTSIDGEWYDMPT